MFLKIYNTLCYDNDKDFFQVVKCSSIENVDGLSVIFTILHI
jgi:hypothetical protein